MPSTSAKQAKFMRAVAHSPKFAKKVGVPQSVGKDFEMADKKKMKKFGDGGASKLKLTDKEKKMGDALMMTRKGKEVMNAQKRMEDEKEMQRRKKQAAADKLLGVGMKEGGMMKKATKAGRAMTKKSADTMGRAMVKKAGGGKCYAKGGTASARADGVAKKGKTKGKMLATGGFLSPGPKGTMVRHTSNKAPRIGATFYNPRGVDPRNAPAPVAAPKPSNMGANMMRRNKGGMAKKGKC